MSIDDVQHYYDDFLEYLVQDRLRFNPRHSEIGRLIRRFVKKGATVLDLGCGIGITSEMAARRAATVVGVDLSPRLIEFARATVPNVEFHVSDLVELTLDRRFGVVCLFDVIEHVPRARWSQLWQAVDRHLTPDGIVLVSTPHPAATTQDWQERPDVLQIVDEVVNPDEVLREARASGFVPAHLQTYGVDRIPQYIWLVLERQRVPEPRAWRRFAYARERLRFRFAGRRYMGAAQRVRQGETSQAGDA